MVISFLQRHPKLAAGHIRAEENLGAMLIELLELYGTRFNFDRVGIAIEDGGSYFEKLDYQTPNHTIWKKICVRDPNDPTNNIAKASHQIERIIKVFGDAFRDLTTRCYLVHGSIERGNKAPWGTKSGSILDSIIEPPHAAIRERLKRAWKQHMSDNSDIARSRSPPATVTLPTGTQNAKETPSGSPKPKKNRAERRAAQRLTQEQARKEKQAAKNVHSTMPPPPPSPSKRKAPTATASSGTKDTPILLEDSPVSSLQLPHRRAASPARKRAAPVKAGALAADNLEASGSIKGVSRNVITID
jgi:DNA polymerase sigma